MWFSTGIRFQAIANGVQRPFLCLTAEDGSMCFEVQTASVPYNRIISYRVKGADLIEAKEKASSALGTLQGLPRIELDDDELNHLMRYRVHC